MAVSSNQKIGELARIAYRRYCMLKVSWERRQTRSTETNGRRNYEASVRQYWECLVIRQQSGLDKAIYLIGNEGSLVAYYHGGDTEDPDNG